MKINTWISDVNRLRYAYFLPGPTQLTLKFVVSKKILRTTGRLVEPIIVFKKYAL